MILKNYSIGIVLSILCFLTSNAQESYNQLVYKGNRSFNSKDYQGSSSQFQEATQLKPKDFTAHYNLGNSYYKRKMYAEAEAEYDQAEKSAQNKKDKAAALYNKGNTLMKTNKPENAAEFYKKALQLDPYNEDIKKNFQIAKLQQGEKNQQQNQQNKKEDSKDSGKDKNNQQNKDDKKGDQPKQQNGNGKDDQSKGDDKGKNQQQKPTPENDKMPKELEDAILNRIDNKEKETARKVMNKNAYSMPESKEKDW